MLCLNFNSKLTPKGREQDSRIHGKAEVQKNTKMVSMCTWLQKKKKQVHMCTVTECKGLHLPTYLILMCKCVCTDMPMNYSVNSAAQCTLYSRIDLMEGHAMQGLIQSHLNFYCYSSFGSPDFISFGGNEMK